MVINLEITDIHSLPSLLIPERDNLPQSGGIYFVLTENNDIEYIGKAKNLRKRWHKHDCCINLDSPKTCRVAWIEVSNEDERTEFEKQFIRKFSPKCNANFIIKTPKPKTFYVQTEKSIKHLLTVSEAAKELNVSARRIHQFIAEKRLPAEKLGAYYVIKRTDLDLVKDRTTGRPPKVTGEK